MQPYQPLANTPEVPRLQTSPHRNSFNPSNGSTPPSFSPQALFNGLRLTAPIGEQAEQPVVTPTKSSPEPVPASAPHPVNSVASGGCASYNAFGHAVAPKVVVHPVTIAAGTTTLPPRPATGAPPFHTTAGALTLNPLPSATNNTADSPHAASCDGASSQPAPQHRLSPAGAIAAYNPLQRPSASSSTATPSPSFRPSPDVQVSAAGAQAAHNSHEPNPQAETRPPPEPMRTAPETGNTSHTASGSGALAGIPMCLQLPPPFPQSTDPVHLASPWATPVGALASATAPLVASAPSPTPDQQRPEHTTQPVTVPPLAAQTSLATQSQLHLPPWMQRRAPTQIQVQPPAEPEPAVVSQLPQPVVVSQPPRPVAVSQPPQPVVVSQPPQVAAANQTTGSDSQLDKIVFLHDMVGGHADMATCRDVLEQVGGDMERASLIMLEMYGGADGTAGVSGRYGSEAATSPAAGGGTVSPEATRREADAATVDMSYDLSGFGADAISGQPPVPSAPSAPQQWQSWDQREAAAGTVDAWEGAADNAAETRQPQHDYFGAAGTRTDQDSSAAVWAPTGDRGVTGLAAAPGFSAGLPDHGGYAPEVAAQGIFSAELPEASVWAVEEQHVSASLGATPDADLAKDASGDADDGWENLGMLAEDAVEDKMEELRIYFPNLDEETLRSHLEMSNGNVQKALQQLSDQYEEEIYRKIEMERQAESDAALARKLAEQDSMLDAAVYRSVLFGPTDMAAQDYGLNSLEELGTEMQRLALAASDGPSRASAAPSGGSQLLSELAGVKQLLHIFGGDTDKELLAEVLANQGGDVSAARAALCSMGLTEKQPPLPTPSPPPLPPPQQQPAQAMSGAADAWSWPGNDAAGAETSMGLSDEMAPGLVSRRCASGRVAGGAAGGMATALAHNASFGGTGASPSRVVGDPLPYSSSAGRNANRDGVGAQPATPPAPCATAEQNNSAAAALLRAGAMAAGAAAAGAGPSSSNQQQLGPIRLLATLGVDYQAMGLSEEALKCIRVAFETSDVRPLMQRTGANSMQELQERQRLEGRRPGGGGLTHAEKQALWEQHRELPLALKAMRDMMRRGAQAAYQEGSPASRRLAKELHAAASALDGVIREQHREASGRIFEGINAALRQQWKTDLHALLPHDIPRVLDGVFGGLRTMGGSVDWLIITGKGLHSGPDGPKVPAIADQWLEANGLEAEPQPGAVLVRLTPEVFSRVATSATAASAAAAPEPGPSQVHHL